VTDIKTQNRHYARIWNFIRSTSNRWRTIVNGLKKLVRTTLYLFICTGAIGAATTALAAAPAAAYTGHVYCERYVETGNCTEGDSPPYTYTIAQNKGENLSGHGICIDIFNGPNPSEHSAYNCAEGKNYSLEEPYSYGWAAQTWNWHKEYSEIWGWYYGCTTYC
jgi:hypothetical protein